jgi:hypothetical protein
MRTWALLALALTAGGCVAGGTAESTPPVSEGSGINEAANAIELATEEAVAALDAMEAADEAEAIAEAQAFMAAYARDLIAGDRATIAGRYHRRGAWRVGNGEKSFETWTAIRDFYAGTNWSPPASFAWRALEYQPLGRDAVVVVGLFDWGRGEGRPPVTVSYTGLLLRQDGELRIRLEDESAGR